MSELLDDPATMTTQQRRHEIAAILAQGMLRLQMSTRKSPGSRLSRTTEQSTESRGNCLDEAARTGPHALAR